MSAMTPCANGRNITLKLCLFYTEHSPLKQRWIGKLYAARSIEDMFDHPQVLSQGLIATYQHPVVGQYRALKRSVRFTRTPGPEPFAAPTLGQHTELIKTEARRIRQNKKKS